MVTRELEERFFDSVGGNDEHKQLLRTLLLQMADAPDDNAAVRAEKKRLRDTHAEHTSKSSRPRRAATQAGTVEVQHSQVGMGLCIACGSSTPGWRCTTADCPAFLCLHCLLERAEQSFQCPQHGGAPLKLSHDVALRGIPLHDALYYHVVGSNHVDILTRMPRLSTARVVDKSDCHALFVVYHANPQWTAVQHQQHITAAMDGAGRVQVVVVLSCWVNAIEQQAALKNVSHAYRGVRFIAYRIAELVLTPVLLQSAVLSVAAIVRFSQPYVGVAGLCNETTGAVLFEWDKGPFIVAFRCRPLCCCGSGYSSSSKKVVSGVRLFSCRRKRDGCNDMLLCSG